MEVVLETRFRKRLREAIDAAGINQSELARRMHVTPALVSQYLSGHRSPGLDVVEKFAKALELNPLMLLDSEKILLANA